MGEMFLFGLGFGAAAGVWVGVRWAERRRALHDIREFARTTWRGRSKYREDR